MAKTQILLDFGAAELQNEQSPAVLPLLYFLACTDEVQLAGIYAEDEKTRQFLEQLCVKYGALAPVFEQAQREAFFSLETFGLQRGILSLGGLLPPALCRADRVAVVCDAAPEQAAASTAFFLREQAACCCGTDSKLPVELQAAAFLLHPEWFSKSEPGQSPKVIVNIALMEAGIREKLPQTALRTEKCPCKGDFLDKLVQPSILVILSEGPSHGFQILHELEQRHLLTGDSLDATGLYRSLKRMEKAGHLVSQWDTSAPKAKRVFAITPQGRQCLSTWKDTLITYRANLNTILDQIQKAEECEE